VQERAGNTLEAIGIGYDFLNRNPVVQQLRKRINKWDYMKLKSFCKTKELASKLKRPMGENLCQLYIKQGTDNQTIQEAQKTKLPKKSTTQ
jgi:mitochondrial fission protein ELM1